jgi:FAD dependent oxidoreductase
MNTDVLVIGAGASGIAAAVAAAESGLRVLVLERYGFAGGMATAAMVGTICGLYYRGASKAEYAVRGFAREFAEAVSERCNAKPCCAPEGLFFLPYQPAAFHQEAAQRLQHAGVQLLLHTQLADVTVSGQSISQISAIAPGCQFTVRAQAVVDCSGEAIVAALANQEMLKAERHQAGAFVFQVAGLPSLDPRTLTLNLIRWIKKGIHSGALDTASDYLSLVPGTLNNGSALIKLSMPASGDAGPEMRTETELLARRRAAAIVQYLSKAEPSLMSLQITAMAAQVGIRTGQRPCGVDVLDSEHLLACSKPDDGVAVGAWPMEYWGTGRQPELTFFSAHDHYLIPAGVLASRNLRNLFFAGRAFSATEPAIASARVIGTCLSTGYAAGMMAASTVRHGAWQDAIERIRDIQIQSKS